MKKNYKFLTQIMGGFMLVGMGLSPVLAQGTSPTSLQPATGASPNQAQQTHAHQMSGGHVIQDNTSCDPAIAKAQADLAQKKLEDDANLIVSYTNEMMKPKTGKPTDGSGGGCIDGLLSGLTMNFDFSFPSLNDILGGLANAACQEAQNQITQGINQVTSAVNMNTNLGYNLGIPGVTPVSLGATTIANGGAQGTATPFQTNAPITGGTSVSATAATGGGGNTGGTTAASRNAAQPKAPTCSAFQRLMGATSNCIQ